MVMVVGVNGMCKCAAFKLALFPLDELSSSTNGDISEGPAQPPLLPSRLKEGDGMLKTTSLTAHLQSDVNVATGA